MFDYFWHKLLRIPYTLHVSRHGDATEPPMVFLHGIGASGKSWLPVLGTLQRDNFCLVIDLLGFGESPKPTWCEYTTDDHLRSVRQTIKKLRLKKPYILVGHSLGALLATRYTRYFPQYVAQLWLLSPPVYPEGPIRSIVAKARTGLLIRAYNYLRSERMNPAVLDKLSRILPLPRDILDNPKTWLPFMRTLERAIEHQTILDDAAHLRVKTEVWYGTLDEVVVPANVRLLGTNPLITLHQFFGNHYLTKRYGELIARYIPPHLKSNDAVSDIIEKQVS